MLSFEEAAHQYAKQHKVALDVARVAVADSYLEEDRSSEEQHRAKVDRMLADNQMFYHPRPAVEGRPVPIDDEVRSAGGMMLRLRLVREAKREGDRYRELSRLTSMTIPFEEYFR